MEIVKFHDTQSSESALEACFSQTIRPMLDAIDRLRALCIMDHGIQLPTIVVVGDQSSGKSSVIESLASISLPHGQGIVTRVPLILRLENSTESEISISYGSNGPRIIPEEQIQTAVDSATLELAGKRKDICNKPITLHIRKPCAPDLTMVDLPGITRVPVGGQPDNIYEQISEIIMEYIKPNESIILNVLSASVDFPTCESIRMSQMVDKKGERTLAVVTKVDKSPEGLYEKVTADAVNIGLGYVCVRNKTDDDASHEDARIQEMELFRIHPQLCRLHESMVGIPALARRLTHIQAESLKKCTPDLVRKISVALSSKRSELEKMPAQASETTATSILMKTCRVVRQELELLSKGDFVSFVEEEDMHYTARMHEIFEGFAREISVTEEELQLPGFTEEVARAMKEAKGTTLPNFVPADVFNQLIKKRIEQIEEACKQVIVAAHGYAQKTVSELVDRFVSGYPKLHSIYKRISNEIISSLQSESEEFVQKMLEREKAVPLTYNTDYVEMLEGIRNLVTTLQHDAQDPDVNSLNRQLKIGLDKTDLGAEMEEGIFHMKTSVIAYWKIFLKRVVDLISLELKYTLTIVLVDKIEEGMMQELMGKGINLVQLMEANSRSITQRAILQDQFMMLKECYKVIAGLLPTEEDRYF